jgi:hypothetical protein
MTTSSRGLLIRHKLHLLTAVPLTGMVLATTPLVLERIHQASQASSLAAQMDTADQIGALVQDVQSERLLAIEYMAAPQTTPNTLLVQSALVYAAVADLQRADAARLTPAMSAALNAVTGLDALHDRIVARSISPNRLNAAAGAKRSGVRTSSSRCSASTASSAEMTASAIARPASGSARVPRESA